MNISAKWIAAAGFVFVAWTPPASAHEDISHFVFVPNQASADVAVIDSRNDTVVARIGVGSVPHQVVVSHSENQLVASNTEDNTVSLIDLDSYATMATITLDVEPEHMALSPNGGLLAVGNIGAGTVSLLSLGEAREMVRIDGLFAPHNLTFSNDGAMLYVANLGANHVSVIDVAKGRVVNEIAIADPTAIGARASGDGGEFQGIINVTPTIDGRLGFAAHGESGTLGVIDLQSQQVIKRIDLGALPWRAYGTADGRYMLVPNNGDRTVSVISTETLEVVATLPGAADMTGVNTSQSGTTAFVISRGGNKVLVYDLNVLEKVGEIALPSSPETGVVMPDGSKLYIALGGSDQVAVIDVEARKLLTLIDGVGQGPWGATMLGARNYCH